jgi:hypothetical protein
LNKADINNGANVPNNNTQVTAGNGPLRATMAFAETMGQTEPSEFHEPPENEN